MQAPVKAPRFKRGFYFASGRNNSSGSLAIPAAIFLASSLVIRFAAARLPGGRFEVNMFASRTMKEIPPYSAAIHGGGKRLSGPFRPRYASLRRVLL